MINYAQVKAMLMSDKYIDKSDAFDYMIDHRFLTLANCRGTGSSTFLKTLAIFLDKEADGSEIFKSLRIGSNSSILNHSGSYHVLWLDFSDFHAGSFEEAMEYLKEKMSVAYMTFYDVFYFEFTYYNHYSSFSFALDIIDKAETLTDLQSSLSTLLRQVKLYQQFQEKTKFAVLIDNLVSLEIIASEKGFGNAMKGFLEHFIVEDVYKYCDIFVQIGDCPEEEHGWFLSDNHLAYYRFTVNSVDMKKYCPEIAVEESKQYPFEYEPLITSNDKWDILTAEERKKVDMAIRNEVQRRMEHERGEKMRYAEELSTDVPLLSQNLGIRHKVMDKSSPKYAELNALLRKMFVEFAPQFDTDDIYKFFQSFDKNSETVSDTEKLEKRIKGLSVGSPKWEKADINTLEYWVQVTFHPKAKEKRHSPASPENIKVYVCCNHTDIENVFVESLNYLLQTAGNTIAAKICRYDRADQMCYWISPDDFRHIEAFYALHSHELVKSMPFVAYKGHLDISKDFPYTDSSHNSVQAHIIADYFKTVANAGAVDLEDMYNNYISKWNADKPEEHSYCSFKQSSALAFVVIMDTIDTIISGKDLGSDSLLLSPEGSTWRILSNCRCWGDVNERWHKSYFAE